MITALQIPRILVLYGNAISNTPQVPEFYLPRNRITGVVLCQ